MVDSLWFNRYPAIDDELLTINYQPSLIPPAHNKQSGRKWNFLK
jgi:hypothetical protein